MRKGLKQKLADQRKDARRAQLSRGTNGLVKAMPYGTVIRPLGEGQTIAPTQTVFPKWL